MVESVGGEVGTKYHYTFQEKASKNTYVVEKCLPKQQVLFPD